VDNLRELSGKLRDARGGGDQTTVEIFSSEIAIAESALPVVRRELRRHQAARHAERQDNNKKDQQKSNGQAEKQKKE
jgi:hypothetical protein